MKKIATILAFALLSCFILSGQEHLKIKNVPIDGNASTFTKKLKDAGLTEYPDAGDYTILQGTFAGLSNCLFMFAESDKSRIVYRVLVMTEEDRTWSALKSTYLSLKNNYSAKYSKGRSYEFFDSPYYEGDGYEMQALRLEKCTYVTYYTVPEGAISIEMKAFSSGGGYILITYEDKQNLEIAKAERSSIVNDDI